VVAPLWTGGTVLALDVDGVLLDPARGGQGRWTTALEERYGVGPDERGSAFFQRLWPAVLVGSCAIEVAGYRTTARGGARREPCCGRSCRRWGATPRSRTRIAARTSSGQARRDEWPAEHPDEARWARDLHMLIERRTAERSSSSQTTRATGEHRSVEARIVDRLQQRRQQLDPATGAVLRRVKTNAPVH